MITTPFSLIRNMLWDDYGYTLSDDPSYMTKKIINKLENNGYKIIPFILNDNPNEMHGRESNHNREGLD
jgi:hypothetical protein